MEMIGMKYRKPIRHIVVQMCTTFMWLSLIDWNDYCPKFVQNLLNSWSATVEQIASGESKILFYVFHWTLNRMALCNMKVTFCIDLVRTVSFVTNGFLIHQEGVFREKALISLQQISCPGWSTQWGWTAGGFPLRERSKRELKGCWKLTCRLQMNTNGALCLLSVFAC